MKIIWTTEKDNYIKENYGKLTFTEMANNLNTTPSTISKRVEKLDLGYIKKSPRKWTKEEIELLKVMAPIYLNKTIAKKLKRSKEQVNKKAKSLKIELIYKRSVWKKWKIDFLKENINKMPLTKIEKELDVNYYQIMDKIAELGLTYTSTRWTKEEINILKELIDKVYIREIAKVLNRTEKAVNTKARRLGLNYITTTKKWTNEELDYIRDNWGKKSISNIARDLKVSRPMVSHQANLINLPDLRNNQYKKWTDDNIEKLRKLSESKNIAELAKYFNTTNQAITRIAHSNAIKLIDGKIHWQEEDNQELRKLAKIMTVEEVARTMNRGVPSIKMQATRLNIKFKEDEAKQASMWTEENTKELIRLINEGKTKLEIVKIMNKKEAVLYKKAKELGLKIKRTPQREWTKEDLEKLRELAKTKTKSQLVNLLGRTAAAIENKAAKLNITIISDRKKWTEEEVELLKKLVNIDKKTPREIAEKLDRTEMSILLKSRHLGLIIKSKNKRVWTEEEDSLLEDLWGTQPVSTIAKKLDRTVSSIQNRVFKLGLGSQKDNNYDGLSIAEIAKLFHISYERISINWISLGLKSKKRKLSDNTSYRYVPIENLMEFLEKNQNIWDSRLLEKNILGKEPDWLIEKRRSDLNKEKNEFKIDTLTKQQLILAKKFFLEEVETEKEKPKQKRL